MKINKDKKKYFFETVTINVIYINFFYKIPVYFFRRYALMG